MTNLCFEGWATYPRNLCISAAESDTLGHDRRLARAEKRLFMEDNAEDAEENEAQVLELGPVSQDGSRHAEYITIESTAELEALCSKPRSSWVFFLRQGYSWGPLQMTAEFLKKLFTFVQVHPEYLDVVTLFSEKLGPVEQSFSSFFSHCWPDRSAVAESACSYNVGYNIKYVAPHGRPNPKDPFSVRETGTYHSFDAGTRQAQWVMIQASEELQERIRLYFARSNDGQEDQIRIHGMIFQAATAGWREYLVYLESEFSKMVSRSFYSNVAGPQLEGDFEADFADIRQLQLFTDKLEKLLQVLQRNIDIGQEIQQFMERARKHSSAELDSAFEETSSTIRSCMLKHRIHHSRIESLVSRGRKSSVLVQNILDIRATESSAEVSSRMRVLAEKNARETRSMSILSFISAVFLPATFLAKDIVWDQLFRL
ncbi:hypothetical protein BDV18DRAFT_164668 [Aspergillus unguis]